MSTTNLLLKAHLQVGFSKIIRVHIHNTHFKYVNSEIWELSVTIQNYAFI